jgi:hypothetical protein
MAFMVEIRFGKSTSKSYPKALTLIKKFSNVAIATDDCQENSVTLYEKEFIEKQRRVTDLWALVSNWSSLISNNSPTSSAVIRGTRRLSFKKATVTNAGLSEGGGVFSCRR